jgi:retron-type reverse transcriptase
MDNIILLHKDLKDKTYYHGPYQAFKINDPKPRDIHKASVRDRLLHHAIYRVLYPYFDPKFIFDSFSCRKEKGTHRAVNRFREYGIKVSQNNTRTTWVLKCDIRKFFASIDHEILKSILKKHIKDDDVNWLLGEVIDSFHSKDSEGVGLPLGNLTSQILVNIYMNEFDHFLKREVNIKYCIRYADDFVIFDMNKEYLEDILPKMADFLEECLKLSLHPNKVSICTLASGIDFLGWVNFPYHRVLRTSTKKRMFKKIKNNPAKETTASYLGLLGHGDGYKLKKMIR